MSDDLSYPGLHRLPKTRSISVASAAPAAAALAVAAGTAGALAAARSALTAQAVHAREAIPHRTDNAPNADGIYLADAAPERFARAASYDIYLQVFGDSTAAGLGVELPIDTPGALLAQMLATETGYRVRLSNKAIVGATSRSLAGQIDAVLIADRAPDVAVIIVGANDITAMNGVAPSARRLGDAVERLRETGAQVVVGTCPDLGTVTAIPQPLRTVLRTVGRRLAAAQGAAVRRAGGRPVPMADVLAREFLQAPDRMFSADRFHPSAAGYELAARTLLPATLDAVGEWGAGPLPEPPERSEIADAATFTGRLRRSLGRIAPR